jgi:hypothetical protein
MAAQRVTTADIESKLREIRGEVEQSTSAARPRILGGAIAGAVLLVLVAFLLGRRRGRRKSTVVEIRRV